MTDKTEDEKRIAELESCLCRMSPDDRALPDMRRSLDQLRRMTKPERRTLDLTQRKGGKNFSKINAGEVAT